MTIPTDKSEVSPATITLPLGDYADIEVEFKKLRSALSQREDQLRRALERVDEYQSDLVSAGDTNTGLKTQLSVLREHLDKANAELEQVKIQRDELRVARDFAELACEKREADCAVMRGALEDTKPRAEVGSDEWHRVENLRREALSTNAGADLLARYREALWLLQNVGVGPYKGEEWNKRCDTLLATVKGGSI